MPSIAMRVAFIDSMFMGDINDLQKVILVSFENRGREDTTITSLHIYSSGGTVVNGLNAQLDARGQRIVRNAQGEPLPGFTQHQYTVEGSFLKGDEVLVEARFGHGSGIVVHAVLNHRGKTKRIHGRKQQMIQRSWEESRAESRAEAELDRARAQQKP